MTEEQKRRLVESIPEPIIFILCLPTLFVMVARAGMRRVRR